MIRVPLLDVCGQSETCVVWMSDEPTPAFFSASMMARAWETFRLSASAAVCAVRRHAEAERRPIGRCVDRPVAGHGDRRADRRCCRAAEVRLRHAGDRGRDEQHAGEQEDVRNLFMHVIRRRAFERHLAGVRE